jgi:hypothetical protein
MINQRFMDDRILAPPSAVPSQALAGLTPKHWPAYPSDASDYLFTEATYGRLPQHLNSSTSTRDVGSIHRTMRST